MKRKMYSQVQPPENVLLRNAQVREEIQNFLLAVDSYPDRVAKEPRVSFHQHLSSFFAAAGDDRHDSRSRRH